MTDLEDKTALVTGASRGIGRAIALKLAGAGAMIAVHYGSRREDALETVRLIEAQGGRAIVVGADLADIGSIAGLFEDLDRELAEQGLSGLDILVNNAGLGGGGAIATVTEELFDRILTINAKAPLFVTQHALPRLRDGGRIVNISSMVSLAAYPFTITYAMAKAALNAFGISLAAELGPRGITVNAVTPGATETEFVKTLMSNPETRAFYTDAAALKRIGRPEDIADVVGFLVSREGGWVTGQVIQASGGMHI